jgi:hypothetical protein
MGEIIPEGRCQRCGAFLTSKDQEGKGEYCNFCMGIDK